MKNEQELVEDIRRAAEGAQVLKLFQPIQRQFNLAVMEARCDTRASRASTRSGWKVPAW